MDIGILTIRDDEFRVVLDVFPSNAGIHKGKSREYAADRAWVLDHSPLTLPEPEKTALRLVAIKMSENLHRAADRLGMAPVSLQRWIGRLQVPGRSRHGLVEKARVVASSGHVQSSTWREMK